MSNNNSVGNDLFLKLKSHFPKIRLGDKQGMSTVSPDKAVFFDFDFVVANENVASVSISIADEGTLKIFFSKNIVDNTDDLIKEQWFDFLKSMRSFAKRRLLTFTPKDIIKKNLDKRDYNFLASKNKDQQMSESSLYGSTRSSYQNLENTKLIIRHSKKIDETGSNSRTRNIESLYIESADGERFKYPFLHLSGARAMQRHVANQGNPYDNFGQYIVSLSEQIYNLRKFNHLVGRHAFLENTEITPIAEAARNKLKSIKRTLESIQKQRGYENIQENFTTFEKKDLDPDVLENLKNRFTIQQFNEELIDLFPYITDLLSENDTLDRDVTQSNDNFTIDDIKKMERMRDLNQMKDYAKKLISSPSKRPMKPQKVAWFMRTIDNKRDPGSIIKLMYDLLLSGEGSGVIGSRHSTDPNSYRKSFGENDLSVDDDNSWEYDREGDMTKDQINSIIRNAQELEQAISDNENMPEWVQEKMARIKGMMQNVTDYMVTQHDRNGDVDEAAPFVKGTAGKGQAKPTGDYDDSDAAQEPVDVAFSKFRDRPRDESYELIMAIEATPVIKMEPFDKASIQKAMDGVQTQIKELTKAAKENKKDKQVQYALERAQARLGLLQSRIATADPQATNNVTRNALMIEHLATHVKDDKISLLLSRIANDYPSMAKDEQREVNNSIRKMMSKVKIVPMFTNEGTTFEEIENLLLKRESNEEKYNEKLDYVSEYAKLLDNIVGDKSNLLSGNPEIQSNALKSLNNLMSSHFPAGTNGINAIESLKDIIDDPELSHKLKEIGKVDSNQDSRPLVMQWIKDNAPQVANDVDIGDMSAGLDGGAPTDQAAPPPMPTNQAPTDQAAPPPMPTDQAAPPPEQAEEDELVQGMQKGSHNVEEYVKSLYDRNTGRFPRGETGVLVSVEKKFGKGATGHAKKMIEQLKNSFDENLMRMRKLAGVS